jgi:hypothetical protein
VRDRRGAGRARPARARRRPNVQDAQGRTPLHLVLASRLVQDPTELVRVLLEAGADAHRPTRAGRSPLDDALARSGESAETYFPRRPLGAKQLDEAIRLMRLSAGPSSAR